MKGELQFTFQHPASNSFSRCAFVHICGHGGLSHAVHVASAANAHVANGTNVVHADADAMHMC